VPKIIKAGKNLTKLWENYFDYYFETRCSSRSSQSAGLRTVWTAKL